MCCVTLYCVQVCSMHMVPHYTRSYSAQGLTQDSILQMVFFCTISPLCTRSHSAKGKTLHQDILCMYNFCMGALTGFYMHGCSICMGVLSPCVLYLHGCSICIYAQSTDLIFKFFVGEVFLFLRCHL